MNPRILYTAFDVVPSPKGSSTHITYFVRGLVEQGHPVTLITAGDPALPERDSYFGATLLRAPANLDTNFLKRALAFGQYVMAHLDQAGPYGLVHFRSVWSGLPLTLARSRCGYRLLYEVNGLPSVEMKYHYPALRDTPLLAKLKEQELLTLHLADAIICPSRVTRDYITSLGLPEAKLTVIPNGIDPELFRPGLRAEHGSVPPTILYLGTLADWQGLETLVAAMPQVVSVTAARLRIVGRGRGRHRKALAKHIRKLGLADYVTVEPPVPYRAVPELIAQAAVCVAPLGYNDRNVTQGCCPIKILEYMACGRPVVAANLPVVRELARPEQEVLLFSPDDPDDLARAILALLADPSLAARLAANAAGRARREFTWQAAQERLLAVYRSLLAPADRRTEPGLPPVRPPG